MTYDWRGQAPPSSVVRPSLSARVEELLRTRRRQGWDVDRAIYTVVRCY